MIYLMCTYDLLKLYLGVLKYLYATYTSLTFHRIRQGSAAINCGESHASTASHPLRFYVQKRFAPKSDRVLDISSSRRQTQTIKFQAFSYRIFFSRPPHHEDERDWTALVQDKLRCTCRSLEDSRILVDGARHSSHAIVCVHSGQAQHHFGWLDDDKRHVYVAMLQQRFIQDAPEAIRICNSADWDWDWDFIWPTSYSDSADQPSEWCGR